MFDISEMEEHLKNEGERLKNESAEVKKEEEELPPQDDTPEQDEGFDDEGASDEEESSDDQEEEEPIEADEAKGNADFARERKASKRKEELELLEQLKIENARLRGMQEAQSKNEQPKATQEDSDPEPDAEYDPERHNAWKIRRIEEQLKEERQKRAVAEADSLWERTDRELSDSNPVYKSSMDYLRKSLRDSLKAQAPNASDRDINTAVKDVEFKYVSNLAKNNIDIDSFFIGEAIKAGHNPFTESRTQQSTSKRPQTDKREAAVMRKTSGSIASVPQGGHGDRLSAEDIAKMSTMDDLFKLGSMRKTDWSQILTEGEER